MQKRILQNLNVIRLDFSKSRLCVDGKSVVKYTVARLIDSIKLSANAVIFMDAFSYDDLKNLLNSVLSD